MTEQQQWTSLLIVTVLVVAVVVGLYAMWQDARRDQSIQQWTDDFIPDSTETTDAAKIRDHMRRLREQRS